LKRSVSAKAGAVSQAHAVPTIFGGIEHEEGMSSNAAVNSTTAFNLLIGERFEFQVRSVWSTTTLNGTLRTASAWSPSLTGDITVNGLVVGFTATTTGTSPG
jgi:hypothetical protein